MNRTIKAWIVLAVLLIGPVHAEGYEPDILEISSSTELSFDGDPAFSLAGQGTLEFWAAVDWTSHPGYDPVLFYSGTDETLEYSLSIAGDRSGVILQVRDEVQVLPHEFTDNQLHHFGIINLDDQTVVVIDGQVRGSFDLWLPDTAPTHFRIGSLPGATAHFQGAIGGIRWWRVALEVESLINYALASVNDDEFPHPDIELLTAASDLRNNTIDVFDDADAEFEATLEDVSVAEEQGLVSLPEGDRAEGNRTESDRAKGDLK